MGWFSKAKKKLRKATKKFSLAKKIEKGLGLDKIIDKVKDTVKDAGKKVVGKIGKVINKIGPIGMIAVAMIAPYMIGVMASMGGVIGAIGTGLQAVGAVVAAPFKAAGALVGKAIGTGAQALGSGLSQAGAQTLGNAVTTYGTKLGEMLGGQGVASKSWGEAATGAFKDVGVKFTQAQVQWDQAFGTNYAGGQGSEVLGETLTGDLGATGASASGAGTGSGVSVNTAPSELVTSGVPGSFEMINTTAPITPSSMPLDLAPNPVNISQVGVDNLAPIDYNTSTDKTKSLLGKTAKATAAAFKASQPTSTAKTSSSGSSFTSWDWMANKNVLEDFQNQAPTSVTPENYMEQLGFFTRRAQ